MHHYANTVCDIVGVREDLVYLWRDYVPKLAVQHPFLLHGLLALSALHLAHLRPESTAQYLQTCDKHQAVAIEKFRSILLSPVDHQLADARFALSSTLAVSCMARSCVGVEPRALDINTITELFILTRGIRDMIHLSFEQVNTGSMAPLLGIRHSPVPTDVNLPSSVSACFQACEQMLAMYGMDPDALQHCKNALRELRSMYQNIAHILCTENVELGDISRWQVMVSMEYITLVQAHNPPALIILAHYATAMTVVDTAWHARDWAECAIRGISRSLDITMQHWMRWPMDQIQDRLSVLKPRIASIEGPMASF